MKPKLITDKKTDVGYLQLKRGKVHKTLEVRPGILFDLNSRGQVLGIELLSLAKMAPHLKMRTSK